MKTSNISKPLAVWPVLGIAVASFIAVPACADAWNVFEGLDGGTGTAGSGGADADAGPDANEPDGPSTRGGDDDGCDFSCVGECVPLHSEDFTGPILAWIGPDDGTAPPPCPDTAPVEQFIWHDDLKI